MGRIIVPTSTPNYLATYHLLTYLHSSTHLPPPSNNLTAFLHPPTYQPVLPTCLHLSTNPPTSTHLPTYLLTYMPPTSTHLNGESGSRRLRTLSFKSNQIRSDQNSLVFSHWTLHLNGLLVSHKIDNTSLDDAVND